MDLAVYVGQASLNPIVVVGQTRVVDAQQVEKSGMEIVPGHGVFGGLPADVVGRAMGAPTSYAGTSQPASKLAQPSVNRQPLIQWALLERRWHGKI